ncbi:MAG: VacB/RNase II family 3'-5' exoribonuclease [Phycisphaeraceae bacterium]|nr:VacB/RNase II family 3'-5' exoribonuclease [Phycisphaeraceae bacterium]
MPLQYRKRLIAHLAHDAYEPRHILQLAQDLRIDDPEDFAKAVKALEEEGVVSIDPQGRVTLPSLPDRGELIGVLRKHIKGFGFVEPTDAVREGSIFIPHEGIGDAMTGDTVRVEFVRDRRREKQGFAGKQFQGEIVEIVKRKRTTFAGEVYTQGGQWLVHPDGKSLTTPIVVRDAESKHVKPGDKVVVDITLFPEGGMLPEGVISKVLGEAGLPDVETQSVILAHNLPGEFPDEVLDDAREAARRFEVEIEDFTQRGSLPGRLDLTGDFIITIDPPDAKDYDDAISIQAMPGGGWKLGVHIADVAHFITPDSPLDREARERGNSVYLPRLVIPMIPEMLSNGICSLQEGVHRFCKSAFATYDRNGHIVSEGVAATIIRSAKRLTYLEAQALIDGNPDEARKHARTPPNYTDELITALREMDKLAKTIRSRRERQGMISLELPDVELIFDENGRVIDAQKEDDAFTHTLIEMFMVEANEILARLFEDLEVPLLRRTHPEPTPGDSDALRKAAMVAGFRIPANPTREELQTLLNATRGTPAARAVHMAVLRTLTKAEYSPALIGHFALASRAYAHFTSPIRRYPDLTVHWALRAYLEATDNGQQRPVTEGEKKRLGALLSESDLCPSQEELVVLGRHCTDTEERAEEAERELRQFLVLQLLSEKIGEEYDGVVTGVRGNGVFVQLDKFLADGMIKTADLPGDTTRDNRPPSWKIDSRTGALVDIHSGRSFNMGDSIRIRIAAVDLARRQLELVLADPESRAAGKAKLIPTKLGGGTDFGGLASAKGAGFDRSGAQKRSMRSKSRDKRKGDFRKDRKDKGKR